MDVPPAVSGKFAEHWRALARKRAEAKRSLSTLGESFTDIVAAAEHSNLDDEHDPEGATIAVSRAQVSSFIDDTNEHLAAIEAAMTRLVAGDYGVCAGCGEATSEARLTARPEADRCISCAQPG